MTPTFSWSCVETWLCPGLKPPPDGGTPEIPGPCSTQHSRVTTQNNSVYSKETRKKNSRGCYRSCWWRSIWSHAMRDGALHSRCHGNPLASYWSARVHRPRVTAYKRKENHSVHTSLNVEEMIETLMLIIMKPTCFKSFSILNWARHPNMEQLPLVSMGGPRGSIIGGPLGSPIMFRGSPMGGPLMSIGGPLISGGGPAAIWDMCTGGAWCGGGAPM